MSDVFGTQIVGFSHAQAQIIIKGLFLLMVRQITSFEQRPASVVTIIM